MGNAKASRYQLYVLIYLQFTKLVHTSKITTYLVLEGRQIRMNDGTHFVPQTRQAQVLDLPSLPNRFEPRSSISQWK